MKKYLLLASCFFINYSHAIQPSATAQPTIKINIAAQDNSECKDKEICAQIAAMRNAHASNGGQQSETPTPEELKRCNCEQTEEIALVIHPNRPTPQEIEQYKKDGLLMIEEPDGTIIFCHPDVLHKRGAVIAFCKKTISNK